MQLPKFDNMRRRFHKGDLDQTPSEKPRTKCKPVNLNGLVDSNIA